MQKLIPFVLLGTLLACLSLLVQTPPPFVTPTSVGETSPSGDLAGEYRVAGVNVDGSTYEGSLHIERHGSVYWLTWEVGAQTYVGIGILQDGVLSVGWDAGGKCAVAAYRVQESGALEGLWSICGTDEIGSERATPEREVAFRSG